MNMDGIEVVREIGRGTYGTVWLVQKRSDQKYLVLKSMDLTNSSQHEAEAARQEVCLLASLRHPNIVSYKGSFELRRQLHLLMGYCEGGDLFTRIKEQQGKLFPEQCIMRWFIQITMALQYLHSHNVLHRDLKTQNIFLTRTGLIKLGDFGIARILGSSIDMATTMIGTPYYMSPELFAGLPYNYKSDVWALGCCLYELVSLKHAFHARDLSGLIFKVSQGKVGAIPKLYSDDLQSLITDMLNRTSDLRPSASQILHRPFVKSHISSFLKDTKQPGKHMQQTSEVQGEKFTKINVSQESKSVKDHIQDEKLTCDIKKEEIVGPKQSAKRVEICPEFVSLQISDDKIKMKDRPKVESKTNGIKECDCLQQEYEEEPAAGQGSKSRRRRHCNKNSNLVSSVSSQEKMLSSDTSDPPTCKVALPTSNYSARERRRLKKNLGVLEPLSKETADNVEKDTDSNVDNPAGQILLPSKIQEVNDFVNILNRTLSDTGEENKLKPSVQGNLGVIPKTGHLSRVSILEDILISEVGKIKATEALDLLKSDSCESWEAQRASIQRMLGEEVFSSVGNIIWQLKLWYSVHHDELDIT